MELFPIVNPPEKKIFLKMLDRCDRLGTNLINYVSQMIHAYNNHYFILYDSDINYADSIFVKSLTDFIQLYNQTLQEKYANILESEELIICNDSDLNYTTSLTVRHLKSDLISYFKQYLYKYIRPRFESWALEKNYSIPFDPKKTILVHLRLEDVMTWPNYDGRVCCSHYAWFINNDEKCQWSCFGWKYNKQTPMPTQTIQYQIDDALLKYPGYEVVIITSPGNYGTGFSYRSIRSDDESLDLYLLCNSEVIILSRSNFSLSSLFFGIAKEVYVPMWGHLACIGPCTKYDNCNFNYFY